MMQYLRGCGNRFNKMCRGGKTGGKAEKKKKKAALKETRADLKGQGPVQTDLSLEKRGKDLVQREELMMGPVGLSQEAQDQLHQDLQEFWLQIGLEVQKTFSPDFSPELLCAAVACILQQEDMDQRWLSLGSDQVPVWRPKRTLMDHNELLGHMVQSQLSQRPLQDAAEDQDASDQSSIPVTEEDATEDTEASGQSSVTEEDAAKDQDEPDQSSVPVTEEVCRMGLQMKQDLLFIQKTVAECYPAQMDILNLYAGLYHRFFSTRLTQLAACTLDDDGRYCLLQWANHLYSQDVLLHPELEGKIDTDSLGPLLPPDDLQRLHGQYMTNTESIEQERLNRALQMEVEKWLKGSKQDLYFSYCFSPLASDIIEVIDAALKRLNCVIRDQSCQGITAHLDSFLSRYLRAVEDFVKGNHGNMASVLKAQLVCEEQFREFVLNREMAEQKREHCLESLNALRDCGYCSLTSSIRSQVKKNLSDLWTPQWLDNSLPVVDSLLDYLDQQLEHMKDLKLTCRLWLLCSLHRDVALRYVKTLLKIRRRSKNEQVGGAKMMKEDVHKIQTFFTQQGSTGSEWVTKILLQVAEVLRLQDPDLIQLELVSLVQTCPDLSAAHVSRLLFMKKGLSLGSIRFIKRSVEENRPQQVSANHSPPFFSKLQMKWLKLKMNKIELKSCRC